MRRPHGIHIISTGKQSMEEFTTIAAKIQHFVDYFHIREKTKSANELYNTIMSMVSKGVPLSKIIVNDRVDVALITRSIGVQLTCHSLPCQLIRKLSPSLMLGCSVHTLEEARNAERAGADFIIYGHIYETSSKIDLPGRGVGSLKEITRNIELPVIAIGGIQPENTSQVLQAGAAGIAVMSGVLLSNDPLQAIKKYSLNFKRGE